MNGACHQDGSGKYGNQGAVKRSGSLTVKRPALWRGDAHNGFDSHPLHCCHAGKVGQPGKLRCKATILERYQKLLIHASHFLLKNLSRRRHGNRRSSWQHSASKRSGGSRHS